MDSASSARPASIIWTIAAAIAALATWICFDAFPGINWPIWTATAVAGLLYFASRRPASLRLIGAIGGTAIIISLAAALTTSEFNLFLIFVTVTLLLSIATLMSARPSLDRITAQFTVAAPVLAITNIIASAFARASEATRAVGSPRAQAALRGIVITVPVLVVFALLLAVADPTFALWRDSVERMLTSWDFLPRTIFFLIFLVLSLGALGYAAFATEAQPPATSAPRRWLGSAERLILMSSVAALLWLFLAVQLSYLFGNLPQMTGSGITFAEYARRGFGELTIVSVATALILVLTERYGIRDERETMTRFVTFALIGAVFFLLASAFNRVLLYEEAYGFTTARLYAKAFMVLIATGLAALAVEVVGELDPGRLFRRVGAAALVLLTILLYWNHEAWIARRNVERYAATGKLDSAYLVRDLSANAVPAIVELLPSLPEPVRGELHALLQKRYTAKNPILRDQAWFEANLRRTRARQALATLGLP